MILIIGASGSGKDTILNKLVEKYNYVKAVTYTTRPPRKGEIDGIAYHFVSKDRFEELIEEKFFAEHALYDNNYYGTPWDLIKDNVIKIIEPQGLNALKLLDKKAVTIYVNADEATRRSRMIERGDKIEDIISRVSKDCSIFSEEVMQSCDIIVENANIITEDNTESIRSSIVCVQSFLSEPRPFFKIAI